MSRASAICINCKNAGISILENGTRGKNGNVATWMAFCPYCGESAEPRATLDEACKDVEALADIEVTQ